LISDYQHIVCACLDHAHNTTLRPIKSAQ
jgi:hypothetical protein